jgi:hypothetical protein
MDVILDDAADYDKDRVFIDKAYEIVFYGKSYDEEELIFFEKLWKYIVHEVAKLPRFKEFWHVLEYDIRQMFNAMYFSLLINTKLEVLNLKEAEIYISNNMISYLYTGIDLMASPSFNKNELPVLREIIWYAQQLARIGNWLSTWKRETGERDYSSGIFAFMVSKGIITPTELPNLSTRELFRKADGSGVVKYFIDKWNSNYAKIKALSGRVNSVNIDHLLEGLENLLKFHLATEGYK